VDREVNELQEARRVFRLESAALQQVEALLGESFIQAVDAVLQCRGRVVVTGMGKSGFIAQKISATLASTGTPSLWLHPADAVHGDLGRLTADDVVIALSNSGETDEIKRMLPILRKIGVLLIAVTANRLSTLGSFAEIVIEMGAIEEACPMGLAPTASTLAMLALGDALALVTLQKRGFGPADYAMLHPGGSLGRQFIKVDEIMRKGNRHPIVRVGVSVKDALAAITEAQGRAGAVCIVDQDGILVGIFTDGDLRRTVQRNIGLLNAKIDDVMTRGPKALIQSGSLALDAVRLYLKHQLDQIPVVDEKGVPVGIIDVEDLVTYGFV